MMAEGAPQGGRAAPEENGFPTSLCINHCLFHFIHLHLVFVIFYTCYKVYENWTYTQNPLALLPKRSKDYDCVLKL